MSSFYITASGDAIIPSDNVSLSFEAWYYDNGVKRTIVSRSEDRIVVPAGDSNLYWFKWEIPAGLEGKTVYETYSVNPDRAVEERTYSNNSITTEFTVSSPEIVKQTENPVYSGSVPGTYGRTQTPNASSNSVSWYQYSFENGRFVKHEYGLTLANSGLVIRPDSTAHGSQINGIWKMKSGYGISVTYNMNLTAPAGKEMPSGDAYTKGSVTALFPEFDYSDTAGKSCSLEWSGSSAVLYANTAVSNKRIHLIPVWFPNGSYKVAAKVTRIFTPAGVVSGVVQSNAITIDGSMFDDWYLGR